MVFLQWFSWSLIFGGWLPLVRVTVVLHSFHFFKPGFNVSPQDVWELGIFFFYRALTDTLSSSLLSMMLFV